VGGLLLAIGGAALISGCTTLQNQSRVDPRTVANYPRDDRSEDSANCPKKLGGDTHGGAINLDCFRFPEDDSTAPSAYDRAAGRLRDPARPTAYLLAANSKVARNRLAAILIKHADDVCTQELGRLTANEAISNTALATVASTLSGIATIVTGEKAKELFAAGSGLATATRSHVNAHVYRNVLSTAVSRAIHIERDKRRGEIQAALAKEPTDYNVDQMLVDVNAYHQTCSFYRGLGLVLEAVDRSKFEESDRAGSLRRAIEVYDRELAALEARAGRATGDAEKDLRNQITQTDAKRQKLVDELAGLKANDPAGDPQP
jgi:hypothetical protein